MKSEEELTNEMNQLRDEFMAKMNSLGEERFKIQTGFCVGATLTHKAEDKEFTIQWMEYKGGCLEVYGDLLARGTSLPDFVEDWEVKK